MTPERFNVWDGVYASFREAPVEGLGYDDPIWRTRSLNAARDARSNIVAGAALDYSMRQRNSVLAVLTATLLSRQPRVRILDFGGGPGFGFLVLEAALRGAIDRVDYRVVEVEGVCQEGTKLFAGGNGPTFETTLPEAGDFDVVFTASTIQYIDDWRAICRRLASFRAPHLLLSDAYAGPVPTFTTLQQYYGSRIAHWILNEGELVGEVEAAGYTLSLDAICDVKILDAVGDLPMDNLPADRRLRRSKHFMFSRRDQ